jgi:hypothetical protein
LKYLQITYFLLSQLTQKSTSIHADFGSTATPCAPKFPANGIVGLATEPSSTGSAHQPFCSSGFLVEDDGESIADALPIKEEKREEFEAFFHRYLCVLRPWIRAQSGWQSVD